VPTYSYSCPDCGGFDRIRPMAEAAGEAHCPRCDRTSRRVWSAPALRALDPALRGALDAQAGSADAPQLVTSLPPRSAADRRRSPAMRRATDPRHALLPRP
jgi:putative FmdB family regulatory protein